MTGWRKHRLLGLFSSQLRSYKRFPCTIHHARYSTEPENKELFEYLQHRIKATGPITVADYMKAVLTNPVSGYYMHRDVFGEKGDFITSPEISQMFGELISIWCVNEWNNLYQGKDIQVVELGPGRGTLADDMLRSFQKFPDISDCVTLHFVEISPTLSDIQAKLLGCESKPVDATGPYTGKEGKGLGPYRRGITKYGQQIAWYRSLDDVPKGLSFYLGHEFLDALPIHKFQKTVRGWSEVLVDVTSEDGKPTLRFVLAPGATAASTAFLGHLQEDERDHVEVCPAAGQIVQEISKRIIGHGGFALFADYGHSGEKEDTFRGFKKHMLHDPLEDPGTADLTADVDFSYLRRCAEVATFGPITQQRFLLEMGIELRLQVLLSGAPKDQWNMLHSSYDMLTNPHKMGERFKFFAMLCPPTLDYVPAGFYPSRLEKFP